MDGVSTSNSRVVPDDYELISLLANISPLVTASSFIINLTHLLPSLLN